MKAHWARNPRAARSGEPLEPRLVLAGPTDTVGDTLATAADLNPFTYDIPFGTVDTAVENPTDVDLFRIDLLAGDRISLDVESLPPDEMATPLDALLRVFDSQGAQLAVNQGTPGTAAALEFETDTAGSFYIGVTGFFHTTYDPLVVGACTSPGPCLGISTGPYILNVLAEGGVEPISDDTLATANLVEFTHGEETSITNAIDTTTDVDLFALVLVEGNEVSATLDTSAGGLAGLLRAFDSDGNQVATNTGGTSVLAFTAVADGVYYVGVSDADNTAYDPEVEASGTGTTTGPYDLNLLVEVGTPFSDADTLDTAVQVNFTPGEVKLFSRRLNTALDVDLFQLNLLAGDELTVDVDAVSIGSLLDSLLRVFDSAGNELTSVDDSDGADPLLVFAVPADGTYYVGISGFCNTTYDPRVAGSGLCEAASTGRYEMRTLVDRPLPDDGDSTLAEATPVDFTSGVNRALAGSIAHRLDADLYRLQLAAGDEVTLDVDAASAGSGLNGLLRVFDSAGNQLHINDDADGLDPGLSFTAAGAGTFYVGVSNSCNADYDPTLANSGDCDTGTSGDYTLNILVETPPPPITDGDSTLATATLVPFASGVPSSFNRAIDPVLDTDLFRLNLNIDDEVTLDVDAESIGSGLNSLLRVFDDAGNQLFINNDADGVDPRLSFTAASAGAFYVGISSSCNTDYDPTLVGNGTCDTPTTGNYTLNVLVETPPPVDDGDSTLATATLVSFTSGETLTFDRAIDPLLDVDLFRLQLNAADDVTLEVDAATGSALNGLLRVFDAAGNELLVNDDTVGVDPRLSFTAASAGTFFVGVSNSCNADYNPNVADSGTCDTGTTGDYTLRVLVETPPPVVDGDSTLAVATPVSFTSGVPVVFAGAIDPTVDTDLYRLELGAGDTVDISVAAASAGSALNGLLRVFDSAGNQLHVNDDADGLDPRLSFTAATAGTFYVGVSSSCNAAYDPNIVGTGRCDGGTTGDYTLEIVVENPPPVDDGDSTLAAATLVTFVPGEPSLSPGSIDPSVDVDMFRLELAIGDVVTLGVVTPDGSTLNSLLQVFSASGVPLPVTGTSQGASPSVSFTAGRAGSFFVGISAECNTDYDPRVFNSGTCDTQSTGDYSLRTLVQRVTPPRREQEPNNNPSTANEIEPSGAFRGMLPTTDDVDLVSVSIDQPGRFNAVLRVAGVGASGRLRLLADDGTTLVTSVGNARVNPHLAPGTYFLAVAADTAGVNYELTTEFAPAVSPRSDATIGEGPADVLLADFNADGVLDMVLANQFEFAQDGNLSLLIGLGDGTFQREVRLSAGDEPSALASADFNGDGHLDLAIAASNGISILAGQGDGTFDAPITLQVGARPTDLVVADFNGDTLPDLAVANAGSNDVSMLLGGGDGTFSPATRSAVGDEPVSIVAADFNHDGRIDLATANRGADNVSVLLGRTGGGFEVAREFLTIEAPSALAALDFNGDGQLDLAVVDAAGNRITLASGDGNGNFAPAARVAIESDRTTVAGGQFRSALVAADFNHDGRTDLAVSNSFTPVVTVFANQADGSFRRVGRTRVGGAPESIAAGDVNGDGRLDLVTGNFDSATASVARGRGNGTFQQDLRFDTGHNPRDLAIADFNSDGQLDFLTANLAGLAVLEGEGDGTLADRLRFDSDEPSSVVVDDFNADGRPDVAAAAFLAGNVQVFLGLGDGTLEQPLEFAAGTSPIDIVSGDFNRDGHVDLVTANSASGDLSLLLGIGDGTFGAPVPLAAGTQPRALVAADLNGDGLLDLAVADETDNDVTILTGTGNGTFLDGGRLAVGNQPRAIIAIDVTGDGVVDLLTADAGSDAVSLLQGLGGGNFAAAVAMAVGDEPRGLTAGDFNADGRLDLATANADSDDLSILLARAGGGFAAEQRLAVGPVPGSIVSGDFNADGRLDLAATSEIDDELTISLGRGDGTFLAPPRFGRHVFQATPVIVDVGADGTLDALLVSQDGDILLRRGRPGEPATYAPPRVINPDRGALAMTLLSSGTVTRLAAIDAGSDSVSVYTIRADGTAARQQTLITGSLPRRITSGDTNGDGLIDVVVLNAGSADVSVFLATAAGGFQGQTIVPVGGDPADVVLSNAPGGPDILVTRQGSSDFVQLENNGDGTFTRQGPFRAGAGPFAVSAGATSSLQSLDGSSAVALGDFNEDGRIDVVTAGGGSNTLSFLAGASGGWANPVALPAGDLPSEIVAVDINRDGNLDLAVLSEGDDRVTVLLGDGRGSFQTAGAFAAGNAATGLSVADTDLDGHLDLLVGNQFGDLMTLKGRGDGTFAPFTRAGRNAALAVADLDGDGRQDWIVANQSLDRISVQAGRTGGGAQQVFQQMRDDGLLAPEAVATADLNGDGIQDMLVANSGGNELLVYMGTGNGQFDVARRFYTGTNPAGVTVSDVNADGRLDVLVANAGSNDVSVLLGDATTLLKPGVRLDAGQGPAETTVGDFDADGILDLLVLNRRGNNVAMLHGLGRGFFDDRNPTVFQTGAAPRSLITGQFDARPGLDFVTTNFQSSNLTFYSDFGSLGASARLDIAAGGVGPAASAAADLNNDGMLDLVVANNASGSVSLLLGGVAGLALSDTFAELGLLHPAEMVLAELGKGEGLRLLITDEGDELVRVFSPEDFLPPETIDPVDPVEPGPVIDVGSPSLLAFFQTGFNLLNSSSAALNGAFGGLVSFIPNVITAFDQFGQLDSGDDGSGESVARGFTEFFGTVLDVSQDVVGSLLKGFNETLGTQLSTDDIAETIEDLIQMYLYGPPQETISALIRTLLDSIHKQDTRSSDAADEVFSDETHDPIAEMIIDDVTGAAPQGDVSWDDLENTDESSRQIGDSEKPSVDQPPRMENGDHVAVSDWRRWTAALAATGAAAAVARRRDAGVSGAPSNSLRGRNNLTRFAHWPLV